MRNITIVGSQIHVASLARIRNASPVKKSPIPMGETATGRYVKKYRLVSNGEKNATPRPPSVMASRTPCEAVQKKK
jgi:hypothetical protein